MNNLEKIKKRVFEIIQIGSQTDVPSVIFDVFIVFVIVLNIVITFCLTFAQLARYAALLQTVELVTIIIFAVEYVLRLWTAQYLYPDMGHGQAKLKFAVSFYGMVDLLPILPYFLPLVFPSGAVAFRMFRVVR
ncbi:MAG: ion transporter, partial [Acetatifactor sp.]|nr:ion transporter [Acetatifactor sp.]